jgi:3-deoxy-D-manno-octulosonic-acid transferase
MRFQLYSSLMGLLISSRSDWKKYPSIAQGQKTLWFHAASAGELEILVPLIEAAVKEGRLVGVSIFSPSAESSLQKLPKELIYAGFSPNESEWFDLLVHFGVSEVLTSKYEAWPGLWRAASLLGLRITVVCASMRSSLRWVQRVLSFLRVPLPSLRFFVLDEKSIPELKSNFPQSECILSADPRWLRVIQRAENTDQHVEFQRWREKYSATKKPYWVIGSAWKEDMDFLSPLIKKYQGTVWVVPHSLKTEPNPAIFAPHANCILVNEMGLLVELYSIAERVWVGGGFGDGIHSTLEPAVYSIPVACGPKNVEKFHETNDLIRDGVLSVCDSAEKVQHWLDTPSQASVFSLKLKMEMIREMIRSILK